MNTALSARGATIGPEIRHRFLALSILMNCRMDLILCHCTEAEAGMLRDKAVFATIVKANA